MRKAMTFAVMLMWGALLVGGAFRPQQPAAGTAQHPQPGYPVPVITLTDLAGQPVSLDAYRGKAVFLNFWASWCPPCQLEMPEIERLAAALPPGTEILTVNMTSQETSPSVVAPFLEEKGYTFPVALDPQGTAGDAYQVISLPTSLFINPEGIITTRINGPLTYRAMSDYLKAARR